MGVQQFDVLVVGAGPAGSTAALVLARSGARVLLIDKAAFPRDKACGDLVGQLGVKTMLDLGLELPDSEPVRDTMVVTPRGKRVHLPLPRGEGYADYALLAPRKEFDAKLLAAATAAGAEFRVAQLREAERGEDGRITAWRLSTGDVVSASFVIGADGATSRVADEAGLVDHARALWGFAVRAYVRSEGEAPMILLWEPEKWRGFPGFGWAFPGPDGVTNVGLGLGMLGQRTTAAQATQSFRAFIAHFAAMGVLSTDALASDLQVLGAWLKMGMVGTVPARDNVLLVGDAAGLTNPLQGEGIAHALASGAAAGRAIAEHAGQAATAYRSYLAEDYVPFERVASQIQRFFVSRPQAVSMGAAVLSAPAIRQLTNASWSIYWNGLLKGAPRGWPRTVASFVDRTGWAAGSRSQVGRWFESLDRGQQGGGRGPDRDEQELAGVS